MIPWTQAERDRYVGEMVRLSGTLVQGTHSWSLAELLRPEAK